MVAYYGDFAEDDTVLIPFNTFTSNDPSASATITNLADADIKVHKDGGLTQIATDGATVAIDFDTITGNHLITIDTSAHADYSTGSEYAVRIEGTTVDGATINAWVGSFSIERAGGVLALLKATTLASIKAETALIVADTNELQSDDVPGLIATLDAVVDTVKVDTAAILVDTGTTLNTHLTDMKGATFSGATDSLEAIRDRGDAAWTTGAGGTPPHLLQSTTIATLASQTSFTLTAGSADDDAYNNAIVVVTDQSTGTQKAVGSVSDYTGSSKTVTLSADPGIFTMANGDTIEIMSALGSAGSAPTAAAVADAVWDEAQADHVAAGSFGVIASEIATIDTEVGVIDGIVDTILVDTADMQPRVAAIEIDTNELQTDNVPSLISALNDLTAAQVNAEVDTALTDYDAPTKAELDSGLAALNDLSAAQVNTEVVDAFSVDTYAEPGQGTPGATLSLAAKIGYLFKAWRNKSDQDATTHNLYNDDGSTVGQTRTVSDDGTTAVKGEATTGA